jgi:hypothetical protein
MAQDATPEKDPVIAAANRAEAEAQAQKAAAEAKSAAISAELAAEKAAIGTLPDSGHSGKVELKTDAGKAEATLLAARAAIAAAGTIATRLEDLVAGQTVRIYAGTERPTFEHWCAFEMRRRLLKDALIPKARELDRMAAEALKELGAVPAAVEGEVKHARAQALAPAAGIALGLDALVKLGGLLQSDYEFGGIGLGPDEELLATAVAGALASQASRPPVVRLAGRPGAPGLPLEDFLGLLTPLQNDAVEAQAQIAHFQAQSKSVRADPNAGDARHRAAAQACDAAAVAWGAFASAWDSLLQGLVTADSTGALPLAKILSEKQISDALAKGEQALFLRMHANVGSYYVRTRLWSFLWGEPFYVAAGVVVSYALVTNSNGDVKAAGVIPRHGGYLQPSAVATQHDLAQHDLESKR